MLNLSDTIQTLIHNRNSIPLICFMCLSEAYDINIFTVGKDEWMVVIFLVGAY